MKTNKKVPEGLQSKQGTSEINHLNYIPVPDESQEVLHRLLAEATSDKPICRFEYQLKTGKPERQFRLEVAELRKKGIRVVSSNTHKGYWIAKSEEEYLVFRRQQMSRVMKIIGTLNAMDGNLLGQEVMPYVLLHGLQGNI